MEETTIKVLLDRIFKTNEEKDIVLEWVMHELVCQSIDLQIPKHLRKEVIHKTIDIKLGKWCE